MCAVHAVHAVRAVQKEKGFKIEYPAPYFETAQYGVANIKLEKAKKKGAKKKKE